jgi:hypothetical protein
VIAGFEALGKGPKRTGARIRRSPRAAMDQDLA